MTADLHTTSPTTQLTVPPTAEDGGHTLLPWLREMRDEHPVWRDAYGVWHVFRYADVARVISDPQVFSSDLGRVVPAAQRFSAGNLPLTNPPRHHQLRRLVGAAFSPKVVTGLAPPHRRGHPRAARRHRRRHRVRPGPNPGLPATGDRDRRAARPARLRS